MKRSAIQPGSLFAAALVVFTLLVSHLAFAQPAHPLPSWNDGSNKAAITTFVDKVTREGSPDFVPVPERIATFDNDGTLWAEKPLYFQVYFILDRIKALAPQHPEWKTQEPFASVLKGDLKGVLAGGDKALIALAMAAQTGMSTADFERVVKDWIATARHPQTGKLYTEMVYQPMLELLAYLRANGFKTFIVSGGGIEFMRPWTEAVYGVPLEQVVGSSVKTQYEMRPDGPVIMRLPQIAFVDDKAGKPVGIDTHIGRRPIAACGNSDGDQQMLEWTTVGQKGARLALLVHHTDTKREYAYDKGTKKALEEAKARNWNVVDMQRDWKVIYPPEKK
ncbi:MAG: HAD family hydrolase [Solidesulfovibrio sp. DCME]|uniref:HAD family hydrolase n=1 Tax=Solidesulfovibrio sp. DCME TaxID=3447380 RepID=UPI003D0A4FAC